MLSDASFLAARPSHDDPGPLGLYIHIPFCVHKCNYCDFNSYAGLVKLHDSYLIALILEIRGQADQFGQPRVDTIYIGGGTPTVLPPSSIGHVLAVIGQCFQVDCDAEITIEANPGTVDRQTLSDLHAHGVNRLSLGIQSLDPTELRLLGRVHTSSQACAAVAAARAAGFSNLNLDLIYGLPNQSVASWMTTLEGALRLQPDHLSLYCLTLEEGTPLVDAVRQGTVPEPDPDLAAEMYESARDLLARSGFDHYELSNWARGAQVGSAYPASGGRSGCRDCRHNCKYWTGKPYLGVGAGAHSYMGGVRWHNLNNPNEYVDAVNRGGAFAVEHEPIPEQEMMAEAMFLGLRLIEGVRWSELSARLGCDPRAHYAQALAELTSLGLLTVDAESARLTPRGQLLGNQVFVRFLSGLNPPGH